MFLCILLLKISIMSKAFLRSSALSFNALHFVASDSHRASVWRYKQIDKSKILSKNDSTIKLK